MADIVLDASAAVEIWANTAPGTAIAKKLPANVVLWVPDGLFEAEVLSVWRRWSLRDDIGSAISEPARLASSNERFRRVSVRALADRAWALRSNISFTDACYVALAEVLGCPLLTLDTKLCASPGLTIATIHP